MAFATVAIIGGVLAVGAGTWSAIDSNSKAKQARTDAGFAEDAVKDQLNSMQAITNPYANATNPYKDLKNPYADIGNPYANLGVATQAAEMQADEADQALANTLDTMMATGAGAGGATALARMALESKKGISASIEQQEASNQKLKAQGEQSRQMAVAQGEQSTQMAIAQGEQTLQQNMAQGEMYAERMNRDLDMAKLDNLQGQSDNLRQQEMAYTQQKYDAFGDIAGGLMGTAGMTLPV